MGIKQILATISSEETRIAILEGRSLNETYVERKNTHSIVGNIYMGRVENVLHGIEAAFVDIGEGRNAFLSADDVLPLSDVDEAPKRKKLRLRKNQTIMVQVTRPPSKSKGARLTTQIAIPSRYLVFAPKKDFVGVSHKISGKERERLAKTAAEIKPDNMGLIVRTEAAREGKPTLMGDLTYLVGLWKTIENMAKNSKPGSTIYHEMDLSMRMARDVFNTDFKNMIVDSKEKYDEVVSYLSEVEPRLVQSVRLYKRKEPLFKKYNVDEQIRDALKPKTWLKSGGYIVTEDTEALTSIDVNTGRYIGSSSLEKTILKTNLEATEEIGHQLRLRDIGGLIIVDFINMEEPENREKVVDAFMSVLEKDRAKTEITDMSHLGLIEMTRKSFTTGLLDAYAQTCRDCEGRGYIPKPNSKD